jgi:hypothetical protein
LSQHAYMALLACYGQPDICVFGLWIMRDTFEDDSADEPEDANVAAAAQWILHAGQTLFRFVQVPQLAGYPNDSCFTKAGKGFDGPNGYTLSRWRFWKEGFVVAAESRVSNKEAKKIARSAAQVMDVLESTRLL